MPRTSLLAAPLLALALSAGHAAAQSPWIHVEVLDSGEKGTQVRVNLPLSAAEAALHLVPKDATAKVQEGLAKNNLTVADLRKIWAELEGQGDAEFVSVKEQDQDVRILREGDYVRVLVTKTGAKAETVRVSLPVNVVNALLSGAGDELDLPAAIAQLRAAEGDLVTVEDGTQRVRIWIAARS